MLELTSGSSSACRILEATIPTPCKFSGWFSMLPAMYLVSQWKGKETKDGYNKTDKRVAGRKGTN
jgi:hypothetical protein